MMRVKLLEPACDMMNEEPNLFLSTYGVEDETVEKEVS
jgi:hypothetical protein